jgi:hypothetical protein
VRNTTKLKTLLLKYSLTFDMDDDNRFFLRLTDKITHQTTLLEAESYSKILAKAYSFLLKELKDGNEDI